MSVENPFTIEVYNGSYQRKGTVGNPASLTVNPRHNQRPTATIEVPSDHLRLADLAAPDARVIIRYDGAFLLSGKVRLRSGQGPASVGTVTFNVVDDFRLLERMLGWANPTHALDTQGTDAAFDTRTGPAESVLKGYVSANLAAPGRNWWEPVTVAASLGRGSTITGKIRFTPLGDTLLPLVDKAGIGVTVQQQGAGLVVDCYQPRVYGRTLSEASGVVQEWSWSEADPEGTRMIAGGPDAGTNRTFRQVIDAGLETKYKDIIEVFTDAGDATGSTDLIAKATTALADLAPKAGLSLKLSETNTFRYDPTGVNGIRVGDIVRVEVGPGVIVEDVLREVALEWTTDNGLVVTPMVGDKQDDPNTTLARQVARLKLAFRNLTAGR